MIVRLSVSNGVISHLIHAGGFEWMSGLKINYHKNEVFVLGVDAVKISNNFNCKLGKLPFTNLAIDIGDRKLGIRAAGMLLIR